MATWIDVNSNYGQVTQKELAEDVVAVKNSIENILSTPIGSRPFQRAYGSKLYFFVHEPMDKITEEDIRVSIIQAIEKWEPRVTIDMKKTAVNRLPDGSGYSVDVFFSLIVPKAQSSVRFVAKRIQ